VGQICCSDAHLSTTTLAIGEDAPHLLLHLQASLLAQTRRRCGGAVCCSGCRCAIGALLRTGLFCCCCLW
jgi:hypothetical protein